MFVPLLLISVLTVFLLSVRVAAQSFHIPGRTCPRHPYSPLVNGFSSMRAAQHQSPQGSGSGRMASSGGADGQTAGGASGAASLDARQQMGLEGLAGGQEDQSFMQQGNMAPQSESMNAYQQW